MIPIIPVFLSFSKSNFLFRHYILLQNSYVRQKLRVHLTWEELFREMTEEYVDKDQASTHAATQAG
jgi:hypothetical protein